MQILGLSLFVICLCKKTKKDPQLDRYLVDRPTRPTNTKRISSLIRCERKFSVNRLDPTELQSAREHRLVEIQMFSFLRKLLLAICCLALLSFFIHSTTSSHSFDEVQHLKSYLTGRTDRPMRSVDDFWSWLNEDFVMKLRAQAWYNYQPPTHLSGYLNDKVHRHIGWALMRQYRVRSSSCSVPSLQSLCHHDYHSNDEETDSFGLGWINRTDAVAKAFRYQRASMKGHQSIAGEHGRYPLGYEGYLYEFRGRLQDLKSNLSALHQYQWIDQSTRAILIQLNLYNPNVQLFCSVSLLIEFLSTGSVHQQIVVQPIHLSAAQFSSLSPWICLLLLSILIILILLDECRLMMMMKREYAYRLWSWIEWAFLSCSIAAICLHFVQYQQMQTVGELFARTKGYAFVDLHSLTVSNRLFNDFLSLAGFFSILRFFQFCHYHRRLSWFTRTLAKAAKELISFSLMFTVIFIAFLCLFYFLFVGQISTCATLFETSRMLFEMSLLKFDAHELTDAASVLGPITFTLFILVVVFVCLSMFLSIINESFRQSRAAIGENRMANRMFQMIVDQFLRRIGNISSPSLLIFCSPIDLQV